MFLNLLPVYYSMFFNIVSILLGSFYTVYVLYTCSNDETKFL